MQTQQNMRRIVILDAIEHDDATAEQLGAKLAEVLKLRCDPDHSDRWQTTWGTKTNIGLARSVARIVIGED